MKRKENIHHNIFESKGPLILSVITFIIAINLGVKWDFKVEQYIDNMLDVTLTLSTMLIGFAGVLLGILFSLRSTHTVDLLFKYKTKDTLKKLFKRSILSGMLVIITSTLLYLRVLFQELILFDIVSFKSILISIWLASVIYMVVATWILLDVIMHIIFSEEASTPKNTTTVSKEEYDKLKQKYHIDDN